jgi:hypothetical protein
MTIYETLPNSHASGVVENLDRRTKPSNNDSLSNTQAYGNPIPLVHDEIETSTGLMESKKPNTYFRFSAQEETSPVRPEQPVTDFEGLFLKGLAQEVSEVKEQQVPAPEHAPTLNDRKAIGSESQVLKLSSEELVAKLNAERRIRHDKHYDELPVALYVGYDEERGYGRIAGLLGDLTVFVGRKKSGKTHCSAEAIAALLSGSSRLNFRGSLPEARRRVLYIDTEQSEYKAFKTQQRILNAAGSSVSPDQLLHYHLRPFSPEERFKAIEALMKEYAPQTGALVIDGVRDLAYDINNSEDAQNILTRLLGWCDDAKILVIVLIHLNKSTDNHGNSTLRGHLGTELENKAVTVIECVKHSTGTQTFFEVKCRDSRERDFDPFAFTIESQDTEHRESVVRLLDSGEFQALSELVKTKKQRGSNKEYTRTEPCDADTSLHDKLILKVFRNKAKKEGLRESEALDLLPSAYKEVTGEVSMSQAHARKFFAHWKSEGWLEGTGKEKTIQRRWHLSKEYRQEVLEDSEEVSF